MTATEILRRNKAFLTFGLLAIIISGLVVRPTAPIDVSYPVITLPDGRAFNTAAYPHLDTVQIGLYNWFRDLILNLDTEDFTGIPSIFTQYILAFSVDAMATLFETTPGYRTDYYRAWQEQMIAKMNSSWMEEHEWNMMGFNNVTQWGQTAGYRGPGNIMWTGHYAMMMALYERFFRTGKYSTELQSYLNQFNHTMTYDMAGYLHTGGFWNCGMIVCEPYIVFVQCNTIPQWTMHMTDAMWNTTYSAAYEYGVNWLTQNMVDDHGCFIDGYFVIELPPEWHAMTTTYGGIGPAMLEPPVNHTAENSYGVGWALMLFDSYEPSITNQMYDDYVASYVRHMYPDYAYLSAAYSYPGKFGTSDILADMFGLTCTKEVGDWALHRKLMNFVYDPWPIRWNGYSCYFDSSALPMGLGTMLVMVNNGFYVWASTPVLMKDLAKPRPPSFFNLPHISSTTGNGLFVHQATYDETNHVFVLTANVHESATLTFSNFPSVQGIQSATGPIPAAWWSQNGSQMTLELPPGVWNLVMY